MWIEPEKKAIIVQSFCTEIVRELLLTFRCLYHQFQSRASRRGNQAYTVYSNQLLFSRFIWWFRYAEKCGKKFLRFLFSYFFRSRLILLQWNHAFFSRNILLNLVLSRRGFFFCKIVVIFVRCSFHSWLLHKNFKISFSAFVYYFFIITNIATIIRSPAKLQFTCIII